MQDQMPKVFVSYASIDGDFAELLKMKLEHAAIEVWRDAHQISPGENWRNEIDSGLLNADVVLVILNTNSCRSSYVTYEWAFALGNGKHVLPIVLEDCEIHPRIQVLQYFDFKHKNRPWEKLIGRIKELCQPISMKNQHRSRLSLDDIVQGIKALANAQSKNSSKGDASRDFSEAASQMMNAKNYLSSLTNRSETILWVDDRPDNNRFEREAFNALGFRFDLASTTDEALGLLAKNDYAAIISDMGRREGPQEGYHLLKKVRQTNKQTPFFIYAGSNDLEHKVHAQERGAQGSTNRANELLNLVTTHVKSLPKAPTS